jgi:hypothetical protein
VPVSAARATTALQVGHLTVPERSTTRVLRGWPFEQTYTA